MLANILFPQGCELEIAQIGLNGIGITIQIFCQTACATCPECQQRSIRPHSHYYRFPNDLPCVGLPVNLQIRVRRFFCDNFGCRKRTFAEQFPELLSPNARQTGRLISTLTQIGFEVSAECGARLSSWCGMTRSPDSFLRLSILIQFL